MIPNPIDISTHVTPRLSALIERLVNDPDADEPPTLGTVRDFFTGLLPPAFGEADSLAALAQFKAADTIVIGAPMYNFTIPSQLKAWIDRVLVAGETFRYTATGAEGLMGDKRVIVAVARGGLYGEDSDQRAIEHAERYLADVFAFIGVTDLTFVVAEGLKISEDARLAAMMAAHDRVARLRPVAA